ncbi:Mediator of RNA polymerase II transcription subunit 23 [Choanephora cucurbitarum]|uniref:Mediator of RNA polymerase II transcription subunit 23 n=1 Tax=Choanephora cucurbitarum TaxID=101091 RepID=A0A1C7N3B5_9FUNG|nr:Mediator of RNA polymerase II transcription subunit 23 [Choanephora cucurbitarum]
MEPLRAVISRLFVDIQDNQPIPDWLSLEKESTQTFDGLFDKSPSRKRRRYLLHPETKDEHNYKNTIVNHIHTTHRIDCEALALDFVRASQVGGGNITDQLKVIMLKYREPPLTLEKASRLITFLHHVLKLVPVTPALNTPQKPFPLGLLLEDITLTLSTLQPAIWIITIQFMLSCLRSTPQLHTAITTPVVLSIIKHVLLELTRLPSTNMNYMQEKSFLVGKELLDLFLIRNGHNEHDVNITVVAGSSQSKSTGIAISYYDVVYSFPKLYGHFLNAQSMPEAAAAPQPSIANQNIWLMTITYLAQSILQDHRLIDRVPSLMAINIIKHILREINTLPADLTTAQVNCLNKGKELINLLLLGPLGDGAGAVSHYDVIVALPDVYGHFQHGTFAQSVHWVMEKFINELGKRRRHLAFLMMPPDASWPLISQMSRRHEYNDLTTRTSYHMFEGDLIEFVKEGSSTNIQTHFRDMLFQRASMDEFRELAMSLTQTGLDTTLIRKAMVSKVRDVIRCIQHYSQTGKRDGQNAEMVDKLQESFNPATTSIRSEDIKMMIPSNIDLWELMIETADQLYSFVSAEFFTYEDLLHDFYDLVYTSYDEPYHPTVKDRITKDNGLVWLLLQLFYIEKVSKEVIQKDFEQDEKLFGKLVRLYNQEQTDSKDAFTLRDLALQCAVNHQKANIRDVANIKHRHPLIATSLQHAGLCYQIQAYFSSYYHSNVPTNSTLFSQLDLQEMVKIAMESQLRQDVVPYTLYVYLVPTKADIDTLGYPSATYIKGGMLNYRLLDLLCVNAKHRLLQVIYKMMLDSETGPRYQSNTGAPSVACVPPNVVDVVYKLLYSAPCSAELMVKEILDKLRRCDKTIKTKHTGEATQQPQLPDQTMRWLQSILQLMNYRFIRFLKYSSFSSGLLHYIRYSISYLENRQCYQTLESFAINVIHMQTDAKLLRSLDDPHREKPIWFAESEMLSRLTVCTISRLIKTRGQADIRTDQIHRVLSSLYEYRIEWSPQAMSFFPPAVQSFYNTVNASLPARPVVTPQKVQYLMSNNKAFTAYILQGSPEAEQMTVQFFSALENQPLLLCSIWVIALTRNTTECFNMPAVRKLLMLISPSRMATNTIDLVDFILSVEYPPNSSEFLFALLDTFIWKNQWINFNHVLFAFMKGSGSSDRTTKAIRYVRYLLLESTEFQNRVKLWDSLDFSRRYWTEEDFHDKLMRYLYEYPEYHEFEAYGMHQFKPTMDIPQTQTKLPIYYSSIISDFVSWMESLVMRLIEYDQLDLLVNMLDKYSHLFYLHQSPLAFVVNILLYYHTSPTLRNPLLLKRILRLLDFEQYTIAHEIQNYAFSDQDDGSAFNSTYFENVIHKLAGNIDPRKCAPRTNPNLPERHFREIGSPAVEGILIAALEIMATPIAPSVVIRQLLNLALLRKSHHVGVSALTLHAIGLLIPMLPQNEYVHPIFLELNELIASDPYLLEVSEPCRLIRCGIPRKVNGRFIMTQSLPDMTATTTLKDTLGVRLRKAMMFPYIFNDYTFNLHNYSTNAPNSFLCLFHSIIHYSSLDIFSIFLEYTQKLRSSGQVKTDVQLLYMCFLIGPALHRIEKLDCGDADFLIELMYMVKQVTTFMELRDGWTTQALEQVYDFLYHIRTRFVKSNELASQLKDIIKSMNPPISQRLLRLVSEKKTE